MVYLTDGLFPTIVAGCHGYAMGYICIKNKKEKNNLKNFNNDNLIKYNFNMKPIKLFDSFAGIGALHQSLKELGVPVDLMGISEIDVDAIISYVAVHKIDISKIESLDIQQMRDYLIARNIGYDFKKNKSSIPRMKKDKLELLYKCCIATNNLGDISLINPNDIPNFDLFNMSFPCTDLSISGKQQGMKDKEGNITRSGLYIYGIEIIKHKRPKYIMIENVKNLIGKKFINDFYSIINEIESYGYKCYYPKKDNGQPTCLNAKDYGIPQNRERIYVICVRDDVDEGNFEFPNKENEIKDLPKLIGGVGDINFGKQYRQCNRIYDSENIAMCLLSQPVGNTGGNSYLYKVKDKPNNFEFPKGFDIGLRLKDLLEDEVDEKYYINTDKAKNLLNQLEEIGILTDDIVPCDSTIMKPKALEVSNCITARYDAGIQNKQSIGVAVAVNTNRLEGLLTTSKNSFVDKHGRIQPFEPKENYIQWDTSGKESNSQQDRVYYQDKLSPTLSCYNANGDKSQVVLANKEEIKKSNEIINYRIRKLTPKECWRLMGFRDKCFDRAKAQRISDSQLYKQAGNSIVVNVLYYVFKELFKEHIINDN